MRAAIEQSIVDVRLYLRVATYPTEFVKTRAQFAVASGSKPPGPIEIIRTTVAENGIRGLYSGCSALVAGNAVKAGVRFLSYDSIKLAVADKEVRACVNSDNCLHLFSASPQISSANLPPC